MRTLKRILFRIFGSGLYRLFHALWFYLRLLRALHSKTYAFKFFGGDVLGFANRLQPGYLVLDIGAFLGGSTTLFARKVGTSGRVIAFEPVHHRILKWMAGFMQLPQTQIEPIALAKENKVTELVIPIHHGVPLFSQAGFADSYQDAALPGSGYSFQRLPTKQMRLDDWLQQASISPESVSAVKVDVEGSEMDLFMGGENFFKLFQGPVLCEFWFNVMPPPGWTWLRNRGYLCRYLDQRGNWIDVNTSEALTAACVGETYGNFLLEKEALKP